VQRLQSVTSTNDVLREQARGGAPEWTALVAAEQTQGRGRAGRAWVSRTGNLHLSILLRPVLEPASLSVLPLLAGIAVAEACTSLGASARLKWPNDIVVGERKLGGILVEASSSGGRVEFVIVGVGLNLLAVSVSLPEELRDEAASLEDESGRRYEPEDAAQIVLDRMRVWYDRLATDGPAAILSAWRGLAVPWWGRRVEVVAGGVRVEGQAVGIDELGALLLLDDAGQRVRVVAGDARALRLKRGGP
jgi:BirA family transcriptional regulator, biotin operon repressor / biotin---[acetyl-CoA-carboxylase] ligase